MCIDTRLLMASLLSLVVVLGGMCLWQQYRMRKLKRMLVKFIQEALRYKYADLHDIKHVKKELSMKDKNNHKCTTIICPKCGCETSFFLQRDAIDEEGDFYRCQHCGWPFQYRQNLRYARRPFLLHNYRVVAGYKRLAFGFRA